MTECGFRPPRDKERADYRVTRGLDDETEELTGEADATDTSGRAVETPIVGQPGNLNSMRQFYGQRGEDRVAYKYFRRFSERQLNRTFLDVGSYDGRHLSNSLFFEEQGWRGICVEANPAVFETLVRNRKCICVNVACSDHEGSVEFFSEKKRPMGTTSANAAEKLRYGWNFQPSTSQSIPARTVDSLLREHGMEQVDFVSIDVDGGEVDVLKGFNLARANPKLICIETNPKQVKAGLWPREHVEEIDRILRGYGFHRLKDHGANSFYSKDRHSWLVRLQLGLIPA